MAKTKVLMADDDKDVLEIMSKQIAEAGYDVVTAGDGEDALNKIQTENPDVVLLDLTMPKKDGFEVLEELRAYPPSTKWQPVIIISGRGELKDIQKGFSQDADHYITKPCDIEDILKGIDLMLRLIPHRKLGD